MYIPRKKLSLIHDVIGAIQRSTFAEAEIQVIANQTCSVLDAHYFALLLFSGTKSSAPLMISNNPPEFYTAYNEVYNEDFLIRSLVTTGRTCVLQRISGWADIDNRNFLSTLASVRPACDGIYVPIKETNGTIKGVWAIARAGLASPAFSDDDVDLFCFISGFLSDTYASSSLSVSMENTAYLDSQGHVLVAGEKLRVLLGEVFGIGKLSPSIAEKQNFEGFLRRYRMFVVDRFTSGTNRFAVLIDGRPYTFFFRHLADAATATSEPGIPYATISCDYFEKHTNLNEALRVEGASYSFTKRECEVIRGILRGMSNKEMAYQMKVDESTVKRHTHNVYEKTGFHSRVELVLNLSPDAVSRSSDILERLSF